MTIEVLMPIVISLLSIFWVIYRDKSSDVNEMEDRISQLETKAQLRELEVRSVKSDLVLIAQQQKEFYQTISKNNESLVRILTILDMQEKEGS